MRLAYLVSRFPTLSETFVVREVLEVRRLGHEVRVYALKSSPDPGYDSAAEDVVRATQYSPFLLSAGLLWANVRTALGRPLRYWGTLLFVILHSLGQPKECLKTIVSFPKTVYYGLLMDRRGVEHIHAHFANIPTLAALIIHRIWGIPFSFTCHAHDLFVFRSLLAEKLRAARFAVAISDYNRRFLERFCAAQDMPKVHVVHCGADVGKLAGRPRTPRPGLVVSVARLTPMKGLAHLVEACAILRERGAALECIIAGDGEEAPVLRAQVAARGLEGIVKLPGRIAAEKVPDLVAGASVFVLPCVQAPDGSMDGVPVSLMEAMAMRVPVISTAVSGIPELVRHEETGLVVPPADPAALAGAIARLLEDKALADRLAEKGCRLVREEFDLRANARRVVELMQRHSR